MSKTNDRSALKKLRCIQRSADRHWVGNGFPVRTLFAYPNLGPVLSPFLLFDYAGPREFCPRPSVSASASIRTAASRR